MTLTASNLQYAISKKTSLIQKVMAKYSYSEEMAIAFLMNFCVELLEIYKSINTCEDLVRKLEDHIAYL